MHSIINYDEFPFAKNPRVTFTASINVAAQYLGRDRPGHTVVRFPLPPKSLVDLSTHSVSISVMPYDPETGIATSYDVSIEAIQVEFDCSWRPGATVSLHGHNWWCNKQERLFVTKNCPKAFRWKPHRPKLLLLEGDIVVKYTKDKCERNDVVMPPYDVVREMAERAEYDRDGEACISTEHTFSFGAATCWFRVGMCQYYPGLYVRANVVLEFGNSENCLRFIQHGMRMLSFYKVAPKLDDELAILGDVWKTLTPLVSNFRDAQRVALQRCLPRSQFKYPEPETQLIRHQTCNARQHHTRPCYLVLHLAIEADTTDDSLRVTVATWSALNDPLAFLPPSNSFSSLNHIHLKFPLPTPQDGDRNSSLSGDQDQKELSISISGRETPFSSGANSPGDNVVISSSHRTIIINHIHAIMGDAFLGTINGGNIGGRNNVNSIIGI
ncbi:hypothetical protein BDN71DRAFT_1452272 [Pleurotus eryngii]|uniref:Uncharacterized protein n=1 Tax=Pleurotus eryngii TaxID=5323 RepID=A0A9P5ZQ03_PLEER|nr:hypothetical protein BDN71DRAFT_1452272 [Pleurotus eryngii]